MVRAPDQADFRDTEEDLIRKCIIGEVVEMYDYLIVGSGLYGAVCARELTDSGKRVLVIEKRPHIAGNVYTEKINPIMH